MTVTGSPVEFDPDIDEALLANARAAAERWDVRRPVREQRTAALERNAPLEADTPARLAARVNHLLDDIRRSSEGRRVPSNPVLKALVERPLPVTAEEINASIVNEVVLGARNFLSVEFLERGVVAARSVGRILTRSGSDPRPRGTGFLVAPGLMLTNHHVLTSPELAAMCLLEMDYEQNRFGPSKRPQVFALEPERFFLNDKALDYALVAVAPTSDHGAHLSAYGWLPLNGAQGKISISDKDYLNIVQHPLGREKEVVIRNNRVLDMHTADEQGARELGSFLHYEADTEKGSSGSPVMNDGWEVVALHHSGVPAQDDQGRWLNKDGNVWRENKQPVEAIQWVANEAVRVSSLVAAISMANLPGDQRALLKQALSAQPPGALGERKQAEEDMGDQDGNRAAAAVQPRTAGPARREDRAQPASPARAPQRSATLEVPLRITISLGDEPSARAELEAPGTAAERAGLLAERLEPQDFADRDGYARGFLGVQVPLPKLKLQPKFGGTLVVPRPARTGDRIELRYHHYSVTMCAGRRLAYISACNVDFAAPANAGRKQGRSSWRTDPRLDSRDQLADRFYDHNDYDKGHLTRRDDAAWGATLADAIAANDDTFFYSNAAPQHFLFNQSDDFTHAGLDLWGDLENFISQQGGNERTRLTIFNGPVFGDHDKPLHDALVPLSFYKIVVWKDPGQDPGAVGFVLDQSDLVANLPEEAIDPGRFRVRQRRIADIETLLDISFGKVVQWDRLAAAGPEEALDEAGVMITRLEDIRL